MKVWISPVVFTSLIVQIKRAYKFPHHEVNAEFTSLIVQIKLLNYLKALPNCFVIYIPHSSDKTDTGTLKKGLYLKFTSLIVQIKLVKDYNWITKEYVIYIPHSSDKTL